MANNSKTKKTQDFVSVKEIRDGAIVLNNGSIVGVLMVSSINLALKSSDEQKAIILQFQNFLNTIEYSTQLFVQSQRLDIRPYISMLEERHKEQVNELIKIQTREYISFIKSFTEKVNIMSKTFYVTVSYNPPVISTGKGITGIFKKNKKNLEEKSNIFEENRTQLEQRIGVIEQGLSRTGVRLARLGTEEAVELLYKLYNPGESEKPIKLN